MDKIEETLRAAISLFVVSNLPCSFERFHEMKKMADLAFGFLQLKTERMMERDIVAEAIEDSQTVFERFGDFKVAVVPKV